MKRAIPHPNANQLDINRAVKERLETISGERVDKILPLSADTATTTEIILKINELLDRLQ